MDNRIDPQLAFLAETTGDAVDTGTTIGELAESGFFGLESVGKARREGAAQVVEAEVLVQAAADAETLAAAGLRIRSQAGDVFTGVIQLDAIERLAATPGVERIESAREMVSELDLAIVETRVNLVHVGPPGRRGAGVIVGIVDSGIDYTHPAFRRTDGTSRIRLIWDQNLAPQGSEASPAGFGYGVQYSNAQINAALATGNPFALVRHQVGIQDHGTHVAGIAAGNGRGSSASQPEFRFMGVAPEADIIVVSVGGSGAEGMATSANALDAVNYCYQRAAALNRACAVNMSLGDNLGPHDGTSLLERGLDNLLGPQGRGFVKSAGNVGSAQHHAGGTVPNGGTVSVGFAQPAGNTTPDQLDFWYGGGNVFRAEVVDSAGNATGIVNVGAVGNFTLPGGNTVRIDHRNNDPFNGDKRIFITITRGSAAEIRQGNWAVRLRSVSSGGGGRFDGWIQRHNNFNQRPTFNAPFESNDRTISTPGTAREVITAANYITRGAGIGGLATSSSRGPTRDGRAAPTIAAPGTNVFSASSRFGSGDPYIAFSGTSMSAPHITGILALMLQKNANRTQEQLRHCLVSTARTDAFTGPVPNTGWGAGKVDAQAALNCTPGTGTIPPTVIQVACHSQAVICQPTVVLARCPTVLVAQCMPSRVTICAPSVATPCATRTLQCTQVTRITCPQPSTVLTCPQQTRAALCGGPSVVDGCPSAPGGCDPFTVVVNPTVTVVNPGTFNPGGVNPGTLNPGGLNPGVLGGVARPEGEEQDWSERWSGIETPSAGYFEYDEGWFDEGGEDQS